MSDRDGDAGDEALLGLALRNDSLAPDLILSRLDEEIVGRLALEAAARMPDVRYLPALLSWRGAFPEMDSWGVDLALAIEACQALDEV